MEIILLDEFVSIATIIKIISTFCYHPNSFKLEFDSDIAIPT